MADKIISSLPVTIQTLLTFGQSLTERLQRFRDGALPDIDESVSLLKQLQSIKLDLKPEIEQLKALDAIAIKVWNFTINIGQPKASPKLLCLLKAFAAKLLITCRNGLGESVSDLPRTFKCCLRAARSCLENEHTALARELIEKCASYEATLLAQSTSNGDKKAEYTSYRNQYFIVRFHLAMKESKSSEVDMWFGKIEKDYQSLDQGSHKAFLVLLGQYGGSLVSEAKYKEGSLWLTKAYDMLSLKHTMDTTILKPNLSLLILQSLIKIPISSLEMQSKDLLEALMRELDKSQSSSMVYLLTIIEYLTRPEKIKEPACQQQLNYALRRFAGYATLSPTIFDTILHYTFKFSAVAPADAFAILYGCLKGRLKDEGNREWIEKSVIMMVHIQGGAPVPMPQGDEYDLLLVLDEWYGLFGDCISTQAAQACLMGVAMAISRCQDGENLADPILYRWCRVGLHKIFNALDDENKARLQRKIMQYWIAVGKVLEVQKLSEEMTPGTRQSPETLFLLFRSAMRFGRSAQAKQALASILKLEQRDTQMIAACINETKTHKKPLETLLWVFKTILLPDDGTSTFGTPAMYRCALKLLDADEDGKALEGPAKRGELTCELLYRALNNMTATIDEPSHLWHEEELQWYSSTAWNMTLDHMNDWGSLKVARLAEITVKFTAQLVKEAGSASYLQSRHLQAMFVECAYCLIRARIANGVVGQKDLYQEVIFKAGEFNDQYREYDGSLDRADSEELIQKALAISAFEFEAAMKLKDWTRAEAVLKHLERGDGRYLDYHNQTILADLTLSTDMPLEAKLGLIESIINNCWTLTRDVQKLARWIRCVYCLTAESEPMRCVSVLEKACSLAQEFKDYPDEEIRWLAIHAFNRAVDFWSANQNEEWMRWAELSSRIAQTVDATLHQQITQHIEDTQQG